MGYYRDADASDKNSEGPVKRFEIRYRDPDTSGTATTYRPTDKYLPEDLLDAVVPARDCTTVVQLSKGLADGQLFYNYLDQSIMLKAQIIHGNAAKRITDTYNYTVSPRG